MKVLTGLLTSLVLALGLMLAPSSTVAANAAGCTYAPTVHTTVTGKVLSRSSIRATVKAGATRVGATVSLKIKRVSTGAVVRSLVKRTSTGTTTFTFRPLARGRYVATLTADPFACKYFSSSSSLRFTV
jgi:hypothetical protein